MELLLGGLKWTVPIFIIIWLLVYLRMKKQGKETSFTKVTKRVGKVVHNFISSDEYSAGYHGNQLKIQEQNKLKRKALNELKDPCPYCKFNLKSKKDKCDECGKEFYPMAHTYRCIECGLMIVVESLKDVKEQICPYCLTQNTIA